jgi:hypothetical protein
VKTKCKERNVFSHSNSGIVGSNPTPTPNPTAFCFSFTLSCVGSGLATNQSLVLGVLQTVCKITDNINIISAKRKVFPAGGICCLGHVSTHVIHLQVKFFCYNYSTLYLVQNVHAHCIPVRYLVCLYYPANLHRKSTPNTY